MDREAFLSAFDSGVLKGSPFGPLHDVIDEVIGDNKLPGHIRTREDLANFMEESPGIYVYSNSSHEISLIGPPGPEGIGYRMLDLNSLGTIDGSREISQITHAELNVDNTLSIFTERAYQKANREDALPIGKKDVRESLSVEDAVQAVGKFVTESMPEKLPEFRDAIQNSGDSAPVAGHTGQQTSFSGPPGM